MALGLELLVHLRPEAVHQHDLHAHVDQGQVPRQVLAALAGGNRLATDADHEGLAAVRVDVGATERNMGTKVKLKTADMARRRCDSVT